VPITIIVTAFLLAVTVVPFTVLALESLMLIPGNYSLSNLSLHYWIGPPSQNIGVGSGEPGILKNTAILKALGNSIKLGVVVSVICGVAGMLIGYTVVRTREPFSLSSWIRWRFCPTSCLVLPLVPFSWRYLRCRGGQFPVCTGPLPCWSSPAW